MDIELVEKLCKQYGFSWDVIGEYIRIISKRKDTYYFLNVNHHGHKIKLYHGNERNNSYMHNHGKHNNIKSVFESIKSHDEIYQPGHRNNKLTRITYDFIKLGLYN